MKRLLFVVVLVLAAGWWQRQAIVAMMQKDWPSAATMLAKLTDQKLADTNPAYKTKTSSPTASPTAGQVGVPVTSATAQQKDFPVYLNGLGTVEAYDTVTVRSRVDGQITKVLFRQGQLVKEGDMLVQIDPRPYKAALDQAKAKKAQDEASLKDDKLNLERYTTLAKQDFATHQQLDTQQSLVNQLEAQLQGDQATIDNAETQLDYTSIKSPLDGKTGFRLVDPGNIVHATDQNGIVTIVKLQPISVVFTAPQEALPQINKALAAGNVPIEAISSDGQTVLSQGHLALVDNTVNEASGAISMKGTFQNDDNALWPGLSVSTRMLVDTLHQVVVVPEDALQHGPNGLYVFVIGADNKVKLQPVTVKQSGHGEAVIADGLKPGDQVVVEGQYRLVAGSSVKAKPMAARNTGTKLAEDGTSSSTTEAH